MWFHNVCIKKHSHFLRRSECFLIRYLFTNYVIAVAFSSGRPPSLVAGCFECPAGSRSLYTLYL